VIETIGKVVVLDAIRAGNFLKDVYELPHHFFLYLFAKIVKEGSKEKKIVFLLFF